MEKTKQRDYLFKKGVIENTTPKGLEDAKSKYKKEYQREYQKNYKKGIIRKEVHFSKEENKLVEKAAAQHEMKTRPFIKACVFAYLDKIFVGVDEEQLNNAIVAINRVGNNINQIAYFLNKGNQLDLKVVMNNIYTKLDRLENGIKTSLVYPPTLEDLFAEAIEKDTRVIDRIEQLIINYKNK